MQSKLAKRQRQELMQAVRQLTPAQRLDAFLVHSRLMAELYGAGREQRLRRPVK